MKWFKKNIYNVLVFLVIIVVLCGAYKSLVNVREGNNIKARKSNDNDCFNIGKSKESSKGIGCYNFHKSELPKDGDYTKIWNLCDDKEDDLDCKICVRATATLDNNNKNMRYTIPYSRIKTLESLMSHPKQKCKLTADQIKTLKRKAREHKK